ncbi:MAG: glutamine-hydrolyzing GMP synthase [Candidatus Omnitrophica bacterium]|nr:glutamine-hydrolyzing GMP synthase [Candidatus Omnitrophota bacterium]
MREEILILDFGSQYNQLIARKVRDAQVFARIIGHDTPADQIRKVQPKGLILSGGPASVYDRGVPQPDRAIFELGIPVLGICYGMQAMAQALGGKVGRSTRREYGKAQLILDDTQDLFRSISENPTTCWMSHGDAVTDAPAGFAAIAHTESAAIAAMADRKRRLFGVQFHPEVSHTARGDLMLSNFVHGICGCSRRWDMKSFAGEAVHEIRRTAGEASVVCALSGGVDSAVTAVLVHRAVGNHLHSIFVDNGLLRKGEAEEVMDRFARKMGLDVRCVRAGDEFLRALKGVEDPELKRKRIGETFIRLFEREAKGLGSVEFLAQGTLYPDLIESRSAFGGPSAVIKTHHNVGGLPKDMELKLIEPLKELFKDEVRRLGAELGLDREFLSRHPFPGPGLAVRIIGEVTPERLEILREADARFIEELRKAGLYDATWQAFAVLLPVRSVGVMGDARTYEHVLALRAVTSKDGMTADWAQIPAEVLGRISSRIVNEVRGINRVVYDVSSKPPATIEWE